MTIIITKQLKGDKMNLNNPSDSSQENKNQASSIFTLQLSKKDGTKVLHIKRAHAVALGLSFALVFGTAVYGATTLIQTKHALEVSAEELQKSERENRILAENANALKSENTDYEDSLKEIQEKAASIEEKLILLEEEKDQLHTKLDSIQESEVPKQSPDDTAAAPMAMVMTKTAVPPQSKAAYTSIVNTAYHKTESLAKQIDKMNVLVEDTSISFASVATEVTQTVASISGLPTGSPIEGGIISSPFNLEGETIMEETRVHKGLDISTSSQILPIQATGSGTVIESDFHHSYGFYVVVDHHNGFITKYAHNTENTVAVGDWVSRGDVVGTTGSTGMSTGIHCHYEITLNGFYQDPELYL